MAAGDIGTHGVSDYSSAGVVMLAAVHSGVTDTFQLALAPATDALPLTGVAPSVS